MKNKIENLIKKDFVELLTGCNISFDGDLIIYKKDGNILFYYQKNENIFRFKHNIWSNFESKYNLSDQEIQELLAGIVEEVLNYKEVTPIVVFV